MGLFMIFMLMIVGPVCVAELAKVAVYGSDG
jgi:hypothetical protein